MELSPQVAEKIISGTLGLLSFIGLIVYLRWMGPPDEDQRKPPQMPKENERHQEKPD